MRASASLLESLEPRELAHEPIKHAHDARVALPRADELLLAQVELERSLDPGENLVGVRVRVGVGARAGVRVRARVRAIGLGLGPGLGPGKGQG